MADKNTILVVEDEVKIAQVLRSYLEREGFQVACAYDGSEALRLFDETAPALVLLDLMLPGLSGEEVCRAIRKRSRAPIIMLTAKTGEEDVLAGLGIGADDYVTKPFSPRQVVARVHAVLRRAQGEGTPLADELSFNRDELVIDVRNRAVFRDGEAVALTPSEYRLLLALASRPGRTYTRDELIRFALPDDFDGYDRVIDTHMKNIRHKIEPDARQPRYILTVHGVGYRFGEAFT
ncbi:MAG TPA: response regulator transcription factor [Clostridia bacterium]|nr:response regulator transcription factor [Clostridia bacterium]